MSVADEAREVAAVAEKCVPCYYKAVSMLRRCADEIEKRDSRIAELEATLRGQTGTVCPFCFEDDFDAIGLKHHLMMGWCKGWNETPRLGGEG